MRVRVNDSAAVSARRVPGSLGMVDGMPAPPVNPVRDAPYPAACCTSDMDWDSDSPVPLAALAALAACRPEGASGGSAVRASSVAVSSK